ncbi:MAG: hypothetical protein C4329_13610 [Chitinophagaceae bacterium]|mgnify:CR=1 FL=1
MSLNNVQLPPHLVADLYKNSLVETHATDVPVSADFRHLGSNHQNILIVVNDPSVAFMADDDLNFLTNILNACKLSLADVAVVNQATQTLPDYHSLIGYFESKVILLFGIEPPAFGLPIQFPSFQIQKFEGQTYLAVPTLSNLAGDKALKGKLWNCLKTIFFIA